MESTLATVGNLDYAIIAGYMALMLSLGVIFKRFNKNSTDYFRSGSRTAWWMVGASSFMTAFSAWTFTGAASAAYNSGISVAVIFIANTFGFLVNAAFLAGWYRQMRVTTLPEVLRERFNKATQQVYAWLGVIFSYLMAGLHLWGVSIFASAIFGFQVEHIIIVLGIVVVFYSTVGGAWSVSATDFVQALILIPLTILVAILSLIEIGGFTGLLQSLKSAGLDNHLVLVETGPMAKFTLIYCIAVIMKQLMVYIGLNDSVKYFAVKDGTEARKAAALAGCMMFAGSLLWFIPPVVARLKYSHLVEGIPLKNPAEAAYAVAGMQLLPTGLIGLLMVAVLGATMSSMDSSLNRNAAIFTRDIVKGLMFPNLREESQLRIGQGFTLVCGAIVISLALYFSGRSGQGIFETMMQIGGLVAIPKLVPLLWALFVRNSPQWIALVCAAFGFTNSIFLEFFWDSYPIKFGADEKFPTIIFTNFALGTVVYWLGTWFYPARDAYRERTKAFFKRMHTPVNFEEEVGGSVDRQQFRIIGISCMVLAVFIQIFGFLPGSSRIGLFFFVSGFIGLTGLLFWFASRRDKYNLKPAPPPVTPVPIEEEA